MGLRKAVGQRGSWFASVGGESLPCVHDYWWRKGKYHDPYGRPDGGGKWDQLAAALEGGRAILTKDRVVSPEPDIRFEREGYIGVFAVTNVQLDENGLRFDFLGRLESLA
jgi:hypothetical protein